MAINRKNIVLIISALLLGVFLSLKFSQIRLLRLGNLEWKGVEYDDGGLMDVTHPLMISEMRKKDYRGSQLEIETTLTSGFNFKRFIASYTSEGLRIKGLLTVPQGDPPDGGWPAIVFNHGYIRPEEYRREQKYIAYVTGFASRGYIVFMPDCRGHQDSEGNPSGAYFSPAYTTDSLNAFYSLSKYANVNPGKIGMWGHSMGGHVTLRSMVVSPDIKAGVIWAGVVASYEDMLTNWRRSRPWSPSPRENMSHRPGRDDLIKEFGDFNENKDFWDSISPINFVSDVSGPIQLHHGTADNSVPWEFSERLKNALEESNIVEYYLYEGADHNLSGSAFTVAMNRSVEFFDRYLK